MGYILLGTFATGVIRNKKGEETRKECVVSRFLTPQILAPFAYCGVFIEPCEGFLRSGLLRTPTSITLSFPVRSLGMEFYFSALELRTALTP